MSKTNYAEIKLKKGREAALLRGHPWVFSGAIASVMGKPAAGDVVVCKDYRGKELALGFYNSQTDIAFRLLTSKCDNSIDGNFWNERVTAALQLRKKIINAQTDAYRLINAEGDGFPGLIVDVYASALVVSVSTAGMEKQKNLVLDALIKALRPKNIYEKSEGRSRGLEGLEEIKDFIYGEEKPASARIKENGKIFEVDFVSGQKTGFFLDQRVNREKLGVLSGGANVLNCFSYSGAFSVYCAAGGARRVLSVDVSKSACAHAEKNLSLNGYSADNYPVIEADVFDYLRQPSEEFDLIILDPPAFAKNKGDVARATRGYKDINLQAIRRLIRGGILASFSCSNHIDEELFYKIVLGATRDAGAQVQVLTSLQAGPDHPVLLAHPEGSYLKGLLIRKMN
jgi:23S rRNA (cytosine1962-C5)-methyltransferase